MKQTSNDVWIRLIPDEPRDIDRKMWLLRGGKWIVFDDEDRIRGLAAGLAPYIDSGEIESAKYWNGDPSAINVYSLDRDRWKTRKILKDLGARYVLVWEYDYAIARNLLRPATFVYSWISKFRTILQSRGLAENMRLLKEAAKQRLGR